MRVDASSVVRMYARFTLILLAISSSCPVQGFKNIVNADMSRVAIYQMTETYKAYPMECKPTTLSKG